MKWSYSALAAALTAFTTIVVTALKKTETIQLSHSQSAPLAFVATVDPSRSKDFSLAPIRNNLSYFRALRHNATLYSTSSKSRSRSAGHCQVSWSYAPAFLPYGDVHRSANAMLSAMQDVILDESVPFTERQDLIWATHKTSAEVVKTENLLL